MKQTVGLAVTVLIAGPTTSRSAPPWPGTTHAKTGAWRLTLVNRSFQRKGPLIMPTVDVIDSYVAYTETGGGALPVVFLHGPTSATASPITSATLTPGSRLCTCARSLSWATTGAARWAWTGRPATPAGFAAWW
jgi:hypothetical protein